MSPRVLSAIEMNSNCCFAISAEGSIGSIGRTSWFLLRLRCQHSSPTARSTRFLFARLFEQKSNSDLGSAPLIPMVQTADFRHADDCADRLHRSRIGRIFV